MTFRNQDFRKKNHNSAEVEMLKWLGMGKMSVLVFISTIQLGVKSFFNFLGFAAF